MSRTVGMFCLATLAGSVDACDLCAINSATTARAEATGFVFTLGAQYSHAHTLQFQSEEVEALDAPEFMESTILHIIPGYNFNRDFGVSLNVPLVRREFRLYEPDAFVPTEGKAEGLGDISLVGRWTPYSVQEMTHSFRVNLLAGVKLPTGDTRYLERDVEEYYALGIGHNHAFSAVHWNHVSLGSGSIDGVFGITTYSRWKRIFATTEAQYYLRTEGEGFRFGDTVMLSGGPGVYAVMGKDFTLNVQVIGRFENTESGHYGDIKDTETGMREIYIGPQIGATIGQHLSAAAGGDVPLDIRNRGFQAVPDYRVHASVTWSF